MSEQEVFDALRYRIETNDSGSRFYLNSAGELHRTDGPAIIHANDSKFWYQNGQLHRTDGPAVEYDDGDKRWFIKDVKLTEAEFNQRVKYV